MRNKPTPRNQSWIQFNSLCAVRAVAVLLLCQVAMQGAAQSYSVLHHFEGGDGRLPMGRLVVSGTTIYGTASRGGSQEDGTIFKVNTDGSDFTVLHSFAGAGSCPFGGLVGSGGMLYGTTYNTANGAGQGTVFKIGTDGSGFSILKYFNGADGSYPTTGLVVSGDTLYGMTSQGGSFGHCGVLFKLNTDGSDFTVLTEDRVGFPGPENKVCVVADSTVYGIGEWFGSHGEVFRINTDGTGWSLLKMFSDFEPVPADLLLSGTTLYGQSYDMVFKMNVDGTGYEVLGGDGSQSGGLVLSGATLYGTSVGSGFPHNGLIFQLQTNGSGYAVLKWFNGVDGSSPRGGLTWSGTTLYGTTHYGGTYDKGVVFSLSFLNIVRHPLSQTAAIGSTVAFGVTAVGVPTLGYQWFFNSTNALLGATNAVLTLTALQPSHTGAYTVVVTNAYGAMTSNPAMLNVVPPVHLVTECTEAALRSALAQGGNVSFASDGTVVLTETIAIANNTVFDAGGHQVTISGNNAVGVFYVNPYITFSIMNLVIANGRSTNGGGIYNDYGTVTASNCIFVGNSAVATDGDTYLDLDGKAGRGGAIYNAGVMRAKRCTFSGNSARGGNGFVPESDNRPGTGGPAEGGAIYNTGSLSVSQCGFCQNSAFGGAGGSADRYAQFYSFGVAGGGARAAAVCNVGTEMIEGSLFAENQANGGSGGNGRNSPRDGFGGTADGGSGGAGGPACGALFSDGPSALVNCTLAGNQARGGAGGAGGAGGYWVNMGTGQIFYGAGGYGGNGGDAQAALYDPTGVLRLTNCTVALNAGTGGSGGSTGANGDGTSGGPPGSVGLAGGGLVASNSILLNTLFATNVPSNGAGAIIDAGHNLSSDATCGFGTIGSLNNTDPKLGPLADNGGSTLTMALLPDSPAIDAGDTASAPPIDQRGMTRPLGSRADIGAYEYCSSAYLWISLPAAGGVDILVWGVKGQTCCLQTSTNLAEWFPAATNQIGPDGTVLFHAGGSTSRQFYRVGLPLP